MGSPINYGFSTSWAAVRRRVTTGVAGDGGIDSCLSVLGETTWRGPLTAEERARLLGHLSDDLAQGAVGIGVLLGYAPDVSPKEYLALAGLAAGAGVPTFTHCRDLVESRRARRPGGPKSSCGRQRSPVPTCTSATSTARGPARSTGCSASSSAAGPRAGG